jgi:hypothetical protein
MMKKILLLLAFLVPLSLSAQEETFVYKGVLDTRPVTLFLKYSDGCGTDSYYGMYQYNGVSKWLLLGIEHNSKGQFCMVESPFTGVLLLTKKGDAFEGIWYSPDRKKTLPVKLKKVKATPVQVKEMQDKYEAVNYEMHDC